MRVHYIILLIVLIVFLLDKLKIIKLRDEVGLILSIIGLILCAMLLTRSK
jgi:hypothetical protein